MDLGRTMPMLEGRSFVATAAALLSNIREPGAPGVCRRVGRVLGDPDAWISIPLRIAQPANRRQRPALVSMLAAINHLQRSYAPKPESREST
jgi:hypothetical protein